MAIFGRSSKKGTPPSPPLQTIYNSQQHHQGSYVTSSQSSWTLVEQRPDASFDGDGSNVAQSQGWTGSANQVYNQPVFVSNNYLVTPPLPERPQKAGSDGKKVKKMQSFSNLLAGDVPSYIPGARVFNESQDIPRYIPGARIFNDGGTQYLNQAAALHDIIASKFNAIVTQIDGESFSGDDRELAVFAPPAPLLQQQQPPEYNNKEVIKGKSKGMTNNAISSALTSTNYFAKVNLYANSRLPPNLPPMKIYLPTYTLLCLAAQYSERVYTKPTGKEKETHVEADWRLGTKAMVIKSVPMDDMNTIVFAIRGTQTFLDWAVNLNSAPASPEGFLDDPGNHCHAGFLTVARKMIKPVAAHLRHLLEEDPTRSKCSLLITGHSAGGAVAALLYSHMLSTSKAAESELTILAGFFKRIHCVSFGAPPISLLPLEKPKNPALRKSIFYSFVNEGDPVARADKAYIRSLLDLYSSPAPGQSCLSSVTPQRLQPLVATLHSKSSNTALKENKISSSTLTLNKFRPSVKTSKLAPASTEAPPMPFWSVPEATLSNAGRIIVLRSVERYETRPNRKKQVNEHMDEGVVAQMVSDQLLRGVVWGDPVCHMMRLYARRIEVLATNAIMGR